MKELQNVPPIVSGVYFLYNDEELVYIGKSTCVIGRVGGHLSERVKKFNRWAWIPAEICQLEYFENIFISRYPTRYNNPLTRYVSVDYISSIFNIRKSHIQKLFGDYRTHSYGKKLSVTEVADFIFDGIDKRSIDFNEYRTRSNKPITSIEIEHILAKCKEIKEVVL